MFSMFGYFLRNITKMNNDTRNASTDRQVLLSLTSITVSKILIFLFNEDKLFSSDCFYDTEIARSFKKARQREETSVFFLLMD